MLLVTTTIMYPILSASGQIESTVALHRMDLLQRVDFLEDYDGGVFFQCLDKLERKLLEVMGCMYVCMYVGFFCKVLE